MQERPLPITNTGNGLNTSSLKKKGMCFLYSKRELVDLNPPKWSLKHFIFKTQVGGFESTKIPYKRSKCFSLKSSGYYQITHFPFRISTSPAFNNFESLLDVFVYKVILKHVVIKYMINGQGDIKNSYHKTLKRLAQPTETTITNHKFHLLEQMDSVLQYSDVLYRFVLYFVRRGLEDNFNTYFGMIPLSEELKSSLKDLIHHCHMVSSPIITYLQGLDDVRCFKKILIMRK